MLRQVLDAGLQPDVHVLFANTGKEAPETLTFVAEVGRRWGVNITWLEYVRHYLPKYKSDLRRTVSAHAREGTGRVYTERPVGVTELGYRIVTSKTASRNGEPFENLIDMTALPSVTVRTCTQEMKVRPIKKHMRFLGYDWWSSVVGIRADEPKRIARMRAAKETYWENILPLAEAGVVNADILAFWARAPFDLQLPIDESGATYGGNCDMCFLKSTGKRARIAKENPEALTWWIKQEERTGMTFRPHGVRYIDLQDVTAARCAVDDDLGDCVCHE